MSIGALLAELATIVDELPAGPQERARAVLDELNRRLATVLPILPLSAWPMAGLLQLQDDLARALQRGKFANMAEWGKLLDWQTALDAELAARSELSLEKAAGLDRGRC